MQKVLVASYGRAQRSGKPSGKYGVSGGNPPGIRGTWIKKDPQDVW